MDYQVLSLRQLISIHMMRLCIASFIVAQKVAIIISQYLMYRHTQIGKQEYENKDE